MTVVDFGNLLKETSEKLFREAIFEKSVVYFDVPRIFMSSFLYKIIVAYILQVKISCVISKKD